MYDQAKHLQLLENLNMAVKVYSKFIVTEPMKPGQTREPFDFHELATASKNLRAAEEAERAYFNQFINEKGRFDPHLDGK